MSSELLEPVFNVLNNAEELLGSPLPNELRELLTAANGIEGE